MGVGVAVAVAVEDAVAVGEAGSVAVLVAVGRVAVADGRTVFVLDTCVVAVAVLEGSAVGLKVAVGIGVGVGVRVWLGWRVGMKGTQSESPLRMSVVVRQLANCRSGTLTPKTRLNLNRVSPGWTV